MTKRSIHEILTSQIVVMTEEFLGGAENEVVKQYQYVLNALGDQPLYLNPVQDEVVERAIGESVSTNSNRANHMRALNIALYIKDFGTTEP